MARRRTPEKLFRIGEVIEFSGLSRQTLHLYTEMGLIREQKRTASGYRLYPPSVFATLERVRDLQKRGYTLRRIRELLDKRRNDPRPATAGESTIEEQRTPKEGPTD